MPAPLIRYQLDPSGLNPDNAVVGEVRSLSQAQTRAVAPLYGPFFTKSLTIYDNVSNTLLIKGTDYTVVELLQEATLRYGEEIAQLILITNPAVNDTVRLSYQVLGGPNQNNVDAIVNMYESIMQDQRPVDWANVLNKPVAYPPSLHTHFLEDVYGFESVVIALERVRNAIVLSDVPAWEALITWIQDNVAGKTDLSSILAAVADIEQSYINTQAQLASIRVTISQDLSEFSKLKGTGVPVKTSLGWQFYSADSLGGTGGGKSFVDTIATIEYDGQTAFIVGGGYEPGQLQIIVNGIELINGLDYTATDGVGFDLASTVGIQTNDTLVVRKWASFKVTKVTYVDLNIPITSNGQSTFGVTDGYTEGLMDLYWNGVKLVVKDDFTADDGLTFNLSSNVVVHTSDSLVVRKWNTFANADGLFSFEDVAVPITSDGQVDYQIAGGYARKLIELRLNGVLLQKDDDYTAIDGLYIHLAPGSNVLTSDSLIMRKWQHIKLTDAVSITRTINGKALSSDIVLTPADINAPDFSYVDSKVATVQATSSSDVDAKIASNNASLKCLIVTAREKVQIKNFGNADQNSFDLSQGGIQYYTAASTANFQPTFNVGGASPNALLAIGESISATLMVTNGATGFYCLPSVQVGSVWTTVKWQGGTAPTTGNANAIDVYSFTIIKTADNVFTVLGSLAKFA